MKPPLRLITIATLIALLGPRTVLALEASLDITQYAHTAWTIRDNFLKGAVRAIVQTPDGYLWLATEFGLVRFDGVRFVVWTPPQGQALPSSNIRSLLAARDGTLWIGTLEGLASWKDGRLNQYADFAGQNVLALLEDHEGTVWVGTFGIPKGKLCAVKGGKVECYGEDGSLGQWVWSIYEDADGRLWAGAETGLWRWKPGPAKRYPTRHAIETPQALAQGDNKGEMLAVGDGLWRFADGKIDEYPFPEPPGRVTPVNVFRDRDGGLWVGTLQRGLLRLYKGQTSVFGQSDGLSGDRIQSFFEDREGNIWVGTMDGLDRFRQTAVFSISVKQGLSSPSVWSVLVARDHTVWLSTLDGLNRWKNGHTTIYRRGVGAATRSARVRGAEQTATSYYRSGTEQQVTEISDPELPDNVGSLYEDERGRIWVSSPQGIARFEDGKFSHVREVPGGWVNAIASDPYVGLWISYQDNGLLHWVDGKIVEKFPWSKLGGNVVASAVIPDRMRGGLWLGFFQGGLVHFKDGQVRASYGKKEGLGDGRVMGLQLDGDNTLWAATEGGLSHLKDGHVATLTTANGLPCNTVHWAMEVDSSFWLYTACGLIRVDRTELERWASDSTSRIQFTVFDSADGVRSHALLTGYTPRVSKSADGKLWFAHFNSVTVVDPRHLNLNKIAPPVHIEKLTADGKEYDAAHERLPPRTRDLEIDYTALSLAAPEKTEFRVKLDGQDNDWRVPVNPRHSHYTNLAPGAYRFRVIASNNSGVWNEQGDTLEFSVDPAYYQTNWFRALCVAGVFGLVWVLYQLRLRQLARQFNMRLEERVGERTRIARDLHDTLLQSFHGILLHFQTGINLLPEHSAESRTAEARKTLEKAMHRAKQAIVEGREAIQGLRSSVVETNDLAVAIRTVGEELAAGANAAAFQVQVEGRPRDLHPILRDEVYRIAGEGIRNAFRHAEAKQIEVEIHYDERRLRVRVRDNGKGIDAKLLSQDAREGHFGLRGMRERAKLIGGKLTVWSEVEAGTELELSIPASRAYTAPVDGKRRPIMAKFLARLSGQGTAKKS